MKKADALFSNIIKLRDGNRCKNCGKHGSVVTIDNSHYWGRRYRGTRFDLDNCDALCRDCHMVFECRKSNGKAYYFFKLQQLGEARFDALQLRAHKINHVEDESELMSRLKKLLEFYSEKEKILGRKR